MAVRAIARVRDFDYGGEGLLLFLDIESDTGSEVFNLPYGPVNGDISHVTLALEIRSFVRQYAITNWGYTFGLTDSVRILNNIDPL